MVNCPALFMRVTFGGPIGSFGRFSTVVFTGRFAVQCMLVPILKIIATCTRC